eukprot:GAFH01001850.1.p2 GENE.GAFH01001850.1~~GAFH01001850.1.p2  ORF type:complete len:360 (-),score=207.26 GAFH01001850.1:317-1372(-)
MEKEEAPEAGTLKLGDCKSIGFDDPDNTSACEQLYKAVFGSDATSAEDAIEKLKEYTGGEDDEVNARLGKLKATELKEIARLLGTKCGKNKEEAQSGIVEMLQHPKDSGKKPRAKRVAKKSDDEKPKRTKKAAKEEDEEEDEEKPKKKARRTKKAVDPEAPKRPKTSFIFFSNAKRAEVKEELEKDKEKDEKVSVGEIAKRLGVMWKALSEDEKAEYDQMHKDAKAEYEVAVKEYESSGKKADWEAAHADDEEAPKKKRAAPKKTKKAKKEEEEPEEEDDEDEKPKEKKAPSKDALTKQIQSLLDSGNGTDSSTGSISLKVIRKKLEEHFGMELTVVKDTIKEIVTSLAPQ